MTELDDLVRRLAEVTDELLALEEGDFAGRFALETERDRLRAEAENFHRHKDEHRSVADIEAELGARRGQLAKMNATKINMTSQAMSGTHVGSLSAEQGGTLNNAMMGAQGADSTIARIAELEQELARRAAG